MSRECDCLSYEFASLLGAGFVHGWITLGAAITDRFRGYFLCVLIVNIGGSVKKICLITIFVSTLVAFAHQGHAAGWATEAVPTSIDIMRQEGFVIKGAFGNQNSCQRTNEIFVADTHQAYDQLYATAMSALMSGAKLKIYVHQCTLLGWHNQTANELIYGGVMTITP